MLKAMIARLIAAAVLITPVMTLLLMSGGGALPTGVSWT
jgi:hypothetical protein